MTIATCMMGSAGNLWSAWTGASDGAETSSAEAMDNDRVRVVKLTDNKCLMVWRSSANLKAIVATLSDTVISFGSAITAVGMGSSTLYGISINIMETGRA